VGRTNRLAEQVWILLERHLRIPISPLRHLLIHLSIIRYRLIHHGSKVVHAHCGFRTETNSLFLFNWSLHSSIHIWTPYLRVKDVPPSIVQKGVVFWEVYFLRDTQIIFKVVQAWFGYFLLVKFIKGHFVIILMIKVILALRCQIYK
jgi:hypothetical protein